MSMYLCVYVQYLCVYVSMSVCVYVYVYVSMYLCVYVSMCLCIYVSMYMYLCVYVSTMYVSMYLCVYVSMCLCIYLSMCLCLCLCIYVSYHLSYQVHVPGKINDETNVYSNFYLTHMCKAAKYAVYVCYIPVIYELFFSVGCLQLVGEVELFKLIEIFL